MSSEYLAFSHAYTSAPSGLTCSLSRRLFPLTSGIVHVAFACSSGSQVPSGVNRLSIKSRSLSSIHSFLNLALLLILPSFASCFFIRSRYCSIAEAPPRCLRLAAEIPGSSPTLSIFPRATCSSKSLGNLRRYPPK